MFVPKGQIDNKSTWDQLMIWYYPSDLYIYLCGGCEILSDGPR